MASNTPSRPTTLADVVEEVRRLAAENLRLFRQLEENERRFRSLAQAAWRAEEEQRRRLAQELHDGLGQLLTALKVQLELLRPAGPDELERGLQAARELAERALREARELSHLLRPQVLDDLGLPAALHWLARTLGESTGLEVRLSYPEGLVQLHPDVQTLIFRVVQEALTNVLKHASTKVAWVELAETEREVLLAIRDQGRGFAVEGLYSGKLSGSGLRGMKDRVELFGGHLQVEASPGRGTTLSVRLPKEPGGASL